MSKNEIFVLCFGLFFFCESQSRDVQSPTTHKTTPLFQTAAGLQGGTVSDHHQRSPVDDLTAVRHVMMTQGRCASPHLKPCWPPGTLMCCWHGITPDGYLQLIRFLKWTFCGKCVCVCVLNSTTLLKEDCTCAWHRCELEVGEVASDVVKSWSNRWRVLNEKFHRVSEKSVQDWLRSPPPFYFILNNRWRDEDVNG